MPRIIMVRHGRAAAHWTQDRDPGLDEHGHAQAGQAVATIEGLLIASPPEVSVLTSPLLRCRETAAPLERHWQTEATVCAGVSEIPSPDNLSLESRGPWLQRIMSGSWQDANSDPDSKGIALSRWRSGVIKVLTGCTADAVIFSHFVAINVAAGFARGIDDVVSFRPDNGSCTVFESDGSALHLVKQGHEAQTQVN
ncbi:MAG: histidine phosphatase family protein [Parvularculales bacterium]